MSERMRPRDLRNCLGRFATGVTVVTFRSGDHYHGTTVNSFTAVSLDPPLVLVSLDRRSVSSRYVQALPFVVNMLTAKQRDLALHFAGHFAGRGQEELAIDWEDTRPAPRLAGCLAYVSCTPWRSYPGGDHLLHLGEVIDVERHEGDPLLFYQGKFRRVGESFDMPWIESLDSISSAGWLGDQPDTPLVGQSVLSGRRRRPRGPHRTD